MKKIISSILAASFLFATCAMNVMAAGNDRTLTVSASKTKDLVAGDTITVEVKVDNDLNVLAASYEMKFDADIFSIDTTGETKKKLANYVDDTWYQNIKGEDSTWGLYLEKPTVGQGDDYIAFAWAASDGIEKEDAIGETVIGKFYLKVKDGVSAENTTITLTEGVKADGTRPTMVKTTDGICDLTTVPCKVTFKQEAPVEDKWSVEINNATGDMAATDDNKVWSVKPSKTGTPANIDKFNLTLTSGEDSIVKSIKTDDLNTIMSAWNTGFEFFIGFENVGNHENVTATWDIAAGTTAIVPTGDAVTAAN